MRTAFSQIRRIAKTTLSSRKVDFLVAGTQKGGTTALDAYLRLHPQICMANTKEVHFFDNEELFGSALSRRALYGLYHANFRPQPQHCVVGESTPIYMYWADAPRRIWEYNPRIKLVILLRNPIERAYSHWNMDRRRGADSAQFHDAIRDEPARCRQGAPLQHRVYSYIDRGFYSEQLRRNWRYFPRENTLILKSEQLRTNPHSALHQITEFLDLPPFQCVTPIDVHATRYSSSMTTDERDFLTATFEHEIKALERMLDWDCSDWLAERTVVHAEQDTYAV